MFELVHLLHQFVPVTCLLCHRDHVIWLNLSSIINLTFTPLPLWHLPSALCLLGSFNYSSRQKRHTKNVSKQSYEFLSCETPPSLLHLSSCRAFSLSPFHCLCKNAAINLTHSIVLYLHLTVCAFLSSS